MSKPTPDADRFDPAVHELWPAIAEAGLREDIFAAGGAMRQASYAGDLGVLAERPRIAVVGSRRASPAGIACAEELSAELAGLGAVIVSGAADGIDMAAHLATLDAGGATIACLPFGLGHINCGLGRARLLAAANRRLLLLSPFPPRQVPSRSTPVVRNRLIASLADAVVAIEFGPGSGTLHCLRFALELGRPVFLAQGADSGDVGMKALHGTLRARGAVFLEPRPKSGRRAAVRILDSARAGVRHRKGARDAQMRLLPE